MDQNVLLERFHKAFADMKQELNFVASFEDLEAIFFLDDYILQCKYVSPQLSRSLSARIRDTFNSWISYLHSLLLPNPGSMINHAEHQLFSHDEQYSITETLHKFLELTSRNMLIGLTKDKQAEARYFDDSVRIWKESHDLLVRISEKVNKHWAKSPVKPRL